MSAFAGMVKAVCCLVLVCMWQTNDAHAQDLQRHPLAHVVHITASLTFDGNPVQIDDLIDCYAGYTGTPTSSPHMVFKPNRRRITHRVPGGGMISFRVSRELCYVNGDQWGSALPSYSAPTEWTPVLEWYDHRDVKERTEGIVYLSEWALNDPQGRLKIKQPFVVSTPEHPTSKATLKEVERQAVERDWYQNRKFTFKERLVEDRQPMEWMVRISEKDWRDPQAARPKHKFKNRKNRDDKDFAALGRVLDQVNAGDVVSLGYKSDIGDTDLTWLLVGLLKGQFPQLINISALGVPKMNADRYGLLLSERSISKIHRRRPYFPDKFDKFVPFRCVDGVVTTAPETLGLRYWYRERCSHPEFYKGHSFFGRQLASEMPLRAGKAIFDGVTKNLWLIYGGK